ncbi:Dityrosine transporter 1 [Lecanora helva]
MTSEITRSALVSDPEGQKLPSVVKDAAAMPQQKPANKPPYTAFTPGRRRFILGIVTAAGFFGPLAGGIYLPALPALQKAFHTSATAINATVSVFMGVLAVAPLFWGSLADYGGRKSLYMVSLLIYIAANILLAALPANLAALYILRVVQGFGAASVLSLGAGTVADVTEPRNRASAMSIVLLGPQLGPVLGPLLGGAITGNSSWRWTFGFLETLRSIVGNGSLYAESSWVIKPKWRQNPVVDPAKYPRPPPPTLLGLLKLLRYSPILIVSLNNALLFAAYYAVNVTLPTYLEDKYDFTTTEVGIAYLAPGLSLMAGSLISGRVSDRHRSLYLKNNSDISPHPEHRLHLQIPGVLVSLSGILMFGWFVHFRIHVAAVIVSTGIASFGMTWVFITTTSYLTESFKETPATLVALASLFRNPAAAVSAVVVRPLISKMGIGWCFTGLALTELLCAASILYLMIYGRAIRERLEDKKIAAKAQVHSSDKAR